MRQPPGTVVLDNEAVVALAEEHHPKHEAALAILEVTNQRRSRGELVAVVVPVAVRVEAGWDRTSPRSANLNRLSRAKDVDLGTGAANRAAQLRTLVPGSSAVDATVAQAAESAPHQPATIATSDPGDFTRLASHLDKRVVIAKL
ncbi:MAG: hypothetical protein ACRDZ7_17665 [Acidimicrobiia bacterium]